MENNDDKNNFEKTISKQNDSGLNLNNINLTHNANIDTNINDIKIDKDIYKKNSAKECFEECKKI